MGQPKLLLPYRNATVIESVLKAWKQSRIDQVVAVVRRSDNDLALRCRAGGALLVQPAHDPLEMKLSVAAALELVADRFEPSEDDAWLLAPADIPRLSATLIDRLLAEFLATESAIVAPCRDGRRGHPVVFRWSLAQEVFRLSEDEGVNALVSRHDVHEVDWPTSEEWADLDTPQDYQRLSDS
jgi:molybdenum cofactor cytidylyltransferase